MGCQGTALGMNQDPERVLLVYIGQTKKKAPDSPGASSRDAVKREKTLKELICFPRQGLPRSRGGC